MISRRLSTHTGKSIIFRGFFDTTGLLYGGIARRPQGRLHSLIYRKILMIVGHLLDSLNGYDTSFFILSFRFFKHDKMMNKVKKRFFVQHASDKGFELAYQPGFVLCAIY
ncbi:MAG: hypothetical protein BWX92_03430 [Deltaproteobacteria bacterium ADurb.Bin135]|nr:MAG: hypothetical protein BWX92_03430 [Deltaproteobacteria bacterium ADurb.Bin135]